MGVPGGTGRLIRRKRRQRRRLLRIARLSAVVLVTICTSAWILSALRRHPALRPVAIVRPAPLYPDPPGIVLHASMTPATMHGTPVDAKRLDEIHAEEHPRWATTFEGHVYHIGYHYVILPDGTVQKGRPDHCIGCHAPHFNTWLGICVVGSFDPTGSRRWRPSRPTAAQFAALIALCERLMSEYHFGADHILRHRDTKSTWCPGRRFPYRAVIARLRQYESTHPETHSPWTPTDGLARAALASARGGW